MLTTRLEHAHSCCCLCFLGPCLLLAQVQGTEGLQLQGSQPAADPALEALCPGPQPSSHLPGSPDSATSSCPIPALSPRWVSATSHGLPESASLSVFTRTE